MLRHAFRLHAELRLNAIAICSKRFKGHSHWQNTKHIKGEKDRTRSLMIITYLRKMTGVIIAKNGDSNPASNKLLASVIEDAKRDNVPTATIDKFLEKSKITNPVMTTLYYRSLENVVIAVTYDSKKEPLYRQAFNKIRTRNKFPLAESNRMTDFISKGVIVSKAPSLDITEAKAEEDAIIAGAEEVEELETIDKAERVFQFVTLHEDLWKVVKTLREMGWTMYENKYELVPLEIVELSEEQAERYHEVITQIENIPEVESVVINVA